MELAPHGLRIVVVAWQTENRFTEPAEHAPEMRISARVVLHDVSRDQKGIDGPVARLSLCKRLPERRQGRDPTQSFGFVAKEVGVRELNQSQYAHVRDASGSP